MEELSKKPDVYERLARAIAPSIYENEDIKKGILLQLFGGAKKDFSQTGRGNFRYVKINVYITEGCLVRVFLGTTLAGFQGILEFLLKILILSVSDEYARQPYVCKIHKNDDFFLHLTPDIQGSLNSVDFGSIFNHTK